MAPDRGPAAGAVSGAMDIGCHLPTQGPLATGEALVDFALARISVPSADRIASAMLQALDERNIHFFVVDAPAEAFGPLAAALRGRDVLLFNATAEEDSLRRDLCAPELVHTFPSLAMRMDALAQYLVSRKWRDILVLEGPLAADAVI